MAKRGTTKRSSTDQEAYVAKQYGGKVSPSSGGSDGDAGDVRTSDQLFECKQTGTEDKYAKSVSVKLDVFEKIADEAWSEGREPVVALRIYNPSSVLSDERGNVDFIVRLIDNDLARMEGTP